MNVASLKRSRPLRRTAVAGAGVLALTAAGVFTFGASASATASHNTRPKPTIVLVHGAFEDASSWDGVIQRLQKAGYPVVAPANPLNAVASDAAYLRSVVDHIQGNVILVSHSYGGEIIGQAGANDSKVKALVYAAALIPAVGENANQLLTQFPGSTLPDALDPVPYTLPDGTTGTDLFVKADKYRQQFASDVPANRAALMEATQRPIDQAALGENVTAAAWTNVPSWDVITNQDPNIPPAAQEFMAKRAHAHITKVNSSHSVAVSHPDVVTTVIEQAAAATTK
ncbi:alpha/beta hydrolase [Rugosimonospora acidiphila]|uniref:Alpha/beta hydrolase n=1 Tax=Rugosimonospora acidiphila TaxID=556531 RepID=A0ABP9RRW2_9ACTN